MLVPPVWIKPAKKKGKEKIEEIKDNSLDALKDLNNFFKSIGDFFKDIFAGIADFFKAIFSYKYFVLIFVLFIAIMLLKKR